MKQEEEEKIVGDLNWDGLHRPRIYYAMATTFCGLFLSVLDGSICNVALPNIARELNISSSDSIWIVNSFQLVIMMTLLPFSSMGERWGYKQVYLRGVVVFTIGSLLCALSHTLPLLVASRVFQGFGASMIMSVNTSLIKLIYPKRRLGEGVGLNATAGGCYFVVCLVALALCHQCAGRYRYLYSGTPLFARQCGAGAGASIQLERGPAQCRNLWPLHRVCRGLFARRSCPLGALRSGFVGGRGHRLCAHATARAISHASLRPAQNTCLFDVGRNEHSLVYRPNVENDKMIFCDSPFC